MAGLDKTVDPFSLSLLSLGVTSIALRRAKASMNAQTAEPETLPTQALARKLMMHALAEASLRTEQQDPGDPAALAKTLALQPDYAGLTVELDVPLHTVFELEGERLDRIESILARRRVEAIIYDADGVPLCALCSPKSSKGPVPIISKLFAMTGVPLVTVPRGLNWREGMTLIDAAFGNRGEVAA